MKKNERMEILKNNGVDTSKYFTLLVNETIPAGTKINISIDNFVNATPNVYSSIANQIVEDGYVKNTKLHRRFVAAHYMRMLESSEGWHGYLNSHYGYMYQFDMMFEEVRVLSKLEKKDKETFDERRQFFTFEVINRVLDDYIRAVKKHINSLKVKKCHGRPYVSISGFGGVFVDEIDRRVLNPIETAARLCRNNKTYGNLYDSLMVFKRVMIKLPYETRKSKNWVDAFQGEGAFYTLKNLIMFHDVELYYDGRFYDKYNAMEILNNLAGRYEGYQMNALLKETIKMNDFNFWDSVEAHK